MEGYSESFTCNILYSYIMKVDCLRDQFTLFIYLFHQTSGTLDLFSWKTFWAL